MTAHFASADLAGRYRRRSITCLRWDIDERCQNYLRDPFVLNLSVQTGKNSFSGAFTCPHGFLPVCGQVKRWVFPPRLVTA
jgi:hypothetical protein